MTDNNFQPIEFTTRRGYPLKVRSVSSWLIADVLGTLTEPKVPTYDVDTKAGTQTYRHYHDPEHPEKSTLKTDADRAAWEQYEEANRQYLIDRNRLMLLLYIHEGIIDPPMPTEDWARRMERYGVAIPEDEDDRLVCFYEREVFGSQNDVVTFMLDVMKAGGDVSEERIASIEASFRRTVERLNQVGLDDTTGQMEVQSPSGDGTGSTLLAPDADGLPATGADGAGDHDGGLPGGYEDASLGAGVGPATVGEE